MDTLAAISSAWRWNVSGLICSGALLALYILLAGLRPSRALAFFLAGDLLLAVLVCSPLDLLARQYLFTAEAVEQMLIGLVLSYLLVLGTPEQAVRRLHLDRVHLPYQLVWAAGIALLSIWFIPGVLKSALNSQTVRGVEYLSLLAGGALFWWPIHSPLRAGRIPQVPHSLLYVVSATIWFSLVGLLSAFSRPIDSAHYINAPDTLRIAQSLVGDWSLSRENDQQTAGLLFWICSATVLLTEVMFIYYRWYRSPDESALLSSESLQNKTTPAAD